jgi:A/G-specific adenine glycosylase
MLQQTQVSRVMDYYDRFVERFPTLQRLAAAPPHRVMESWRGLGYYARVRNLHQLARLVTGSGSQLPTEPSALCALPGIGAYTAGAIASFAFERRAALVDTNVARVLRRVFVPNLTPGAARTERTVWAIAEAVLPLSGASAWWHNQALIELGALVCTARVMHCEKCPVRALCLTYKR